MSSNYTCHEAATSLLTLPAFVGVMYDHVPGCALLALVLNGEDAVVTAHSLGVILRGNQSNTVMVTRSSPTTPLTHSHHTPLTLSPHSPHSTMPH